MSTEKEDEPPSEQEVIKVLDHIKKLDSSLNYDHKGRFIRISNAEYPFLALLEIDGSDLNVQPNSDPVVIEMLKQAYKKGNITYRTT